MFPAFVKLIDRQKAYQESLKSLGDGVGRVEIYQGIFPASLMMIG